MMNFDLHTHSTASDGALTPTELVRRALANGVTTLSITDHDTVASYRQLGDVAADTLNIVTGIEISTCWSNIEVHIVGLNIDAGGAAMVAATHRQQLARAERAAHIAKRLDAMGIDNALSAVTEEAAGGIIGRPHFARFLVANGYAKDMRQAFRRYLSPAKIGGLRKFWPDVATVNGWIQNAGGIAVLAHPSHYGLTRRRLRMLLEDFAAAGGRAIEVVSGRQTPETTALIASLASDFELLASRGSDFHRPDPHRADVGLIAELPAGLRPVWEAW